MYQESLNEVLFAILLHESHRSYPSRRRDCLYVFYFSFFVINTTIWANLPCLKVYPRNSALNLRICSFMARTPKLMLVMYFIVFCYVSVFLYFVFCCVFCLLCFVFCCVLCHVLFCVFCYVVFSVLRFVLFCIVLCFVLCSIFGLCSIMMLCCNFCVE